VSSDIAAKLPASRKTHVAGIVAIHEPPGQPPVSDRRDMADRSR
jgi:hypothetical protein